MLTDDRAKFMMDKIKNLLPSISPDSLIKIGDVIYQALDDAWDDGYDQGAKDSSEY